MAVTMSSQSRQLWQGVSGDAKPTGFNVYNGDAFYQIDTQTWFLYNAVTKTWAASASPPPQRLL